MGNSSQYTHTDSGEEVEVAGSAIGVRKEMDNPKEITECEAEDSVHTNRGNNEEVDVCDQEYTPVLDIYSMLTVFPVRDKAFIYAFFIFVIQISILVLFIADQMSEATAENPLHLPVYTTAPVFFGQIFALYVTSMTASDVTQSLDVFYIVYDEKIEAHFPSASKKRWILANFLRGVEGSISIIVAFLFIVQSTDNLDLFQNFAAVAFVSELDNIAFYLAHKGYTVTSLTSRTSRIKEHLVFKNQPRQRQIKYIQKRVMRLLILALYGLYIFTAIQRMSGTIFEQKCQSFVVLFDPVEYDFFRICEKCPDPWKTRGGKIVFPNFNGIYEVQRKPSGRINMTVAGYPAYIQVGEGNKTLMSDEIKPDEPRGQIKYCVSEKAWVFIIEGVTKDPTNANEEACPWLMRSPETTEFDINLVPKDGWMMWTGLVKPAERFRIVCSECEKPRVSKEDFEADNFELTVEDSNSFCNYHGVCSKETKSCRCERESGWMGVQCQICADCESYFVASPDGVNFSGYFYRIDDDKDLPIEVHSRPAFYKGLNVSSNLPNPEMIVLLHTGNRYAFWNITDQLTPTDNPLETRDQILRILSNFHSQWVLKDEAVPLRSIPTTATDPFNLSWTGFGKDRISFIFDCTVPGSECSKIQQ